MEGQITWFVYMVGAIIKGRLTTGSTDTQEVMDGDLSARVLKLLLVVDTPILMQARCCYTVVITVFNKCLCPSIAVLCSLSTQGRRDVSEW